MHCATVPRCASRCPTTSKPEPEPHPNLNLDPNPWNNLKLKPKPTRKPTPEQARLAFSTDPVDMTSATNHRARRRMPIRALPDARSAGGRSARGLTGGGGGGRLIKTPAHQSPTYRPPATAGGERRPGAWDAPASGGIGDALPPRDY
eukprot:scaffold50282_cov44-Phaeocystis_antarctica.AAC.3